MCSYGLNLNVTNMSGDIFVNFSLMTVGDIVALLLFALLVERVGRRLFLLVTAGMGGLACLAAILPSMLGANGEFKLPEYNFELFVHFSVSGFRKRNTTKRRGKKLNERKTEGKKERKKESTNKRTKKKKLTLYVLNHKINF